MDLPLVIVGYSLGSAPAMHVAAHERMRSKTMMVVLFAPLLSAISVFFRSSKLSFLYSAMDLFKTEANARALAHHAIICHGTDDDVRFLPFRRLPSRTGLRHAPDAASLVCSLSASSMGPPWPGS